MPIQFEDGMPNTMRTDHVEESMEVDQDLERKGSETGTLVLREERQA